MYVFAVLKNDEHNEEWYLIFMHEYKTTKK